MLGESGVKQIYPIIVHLPLVLGFTVIIIPNLDPAKLGSLVLKYKPEHMFGVPAHYQQLAADPKLRDKDLSFILNYAAGGDAIARGAEQTVNDFLAELLAEMFCVPPAQV